MELRTCDYEDCGEEYEPKTHNQRYCTDECTRLATNKRIMEKYYEKKAIRSGVRRVCVGRGCNTVLSRYNDGTECGLCAAKRREQMKDLLRDLN